MPRIPEETIERLKQEVSLERLATARGVKLTRHGADLIGLCPFHDDRQPSLVISPKKNLWHCLGRADENQTAARRRFRVDCGGGKGSSRRARLHHQHQTPSRAMAPGNGILGRGQGGCLRTAGQLVGGLRDIGSSS